MKWIFFVLMTCTPIISFAQDTNNYISVATNVPLNFVISNPNDLVNDMVLQNALTITVRSKSTGCSIYAKLASFSAPSGVYSTTGLISLDWTSDNSNKDYNLIPGEVILTSNDQELFDQKKHPNPYNYNYNLILKAPGYNFSEGNYSFTIQFTMTQP